MTVPSGGDPGQGAAAGRLVVAHGARPQRAVRRDRGVVGTPAGDGLAVQPAEARRPAPYEPDAVTEVDDQSAARAGLGRADVLLGGHDGAAAGGGVVGVDPGAEDVHPDQPPGGRRPRSGPRRARPGRGTATSRSRPSCVVMSRAPVAEALGQFGGALGGELLQLGAALLAPADHRHGDGQRGDDLPVRSRTGAATQLTSGLDSRLLHRDAALARISASWPAQDGRLGDAVRRHRGERRRRPGSARSSSAVGSEASSILPTEVQCAGSRRPGGGHHPDRVGGVHLGDVDDVGALEDRRRARSRHRSRRRSGPPAGPRRPGRAARRSGCRAGTAARRAGSGRAGRAPAPDRSGRRAWSPVRARWCAGSRSLRVISGAESVPSPSRKSSSMSRARVTAGTRRPTVDHPPF